MSVSLVTLQHAFTHPERCVCVGADYPIEYAEDEVNGSTAG